MVPRPLARPGRGSHGKIAHPLLSVQACHREARDRSTVRSRNNNGAGLRRLGRRRDLGSLRAPPPPDVDAPPRRGAPGRLRVTRKEGPDTLFLPV